MAKNISLTENERPEFRKYQVGNILLTIKRFAEVNENVLEDLICGLYENIDVQISQIAQELTELIRLVKKIKLEQK